MSTPYWAATVGIFMLLFLTWCASLTGWGLPTTARSQAWSVRSGSVGYRGSGYGHTGGYSGGGSHGGK